MSLTHSYNWLHIIKLVKTPWRLNSCDSLKRIILTFQCAKFVTDCTARKDFDHGRCKERPIETRCWRQNWARTIRRNTWGGEQHSIGEHCSTRCWWWRWGSNALLIPPGWSVSYSGWDFLFHICVLLNRTPLVLKKKILNRSYCKWFWLKICSVQIQLPTCPLYSMSV